jgi:hypothetical protein
MLETKSDQALKSPRQSSPAMLETKSDQALEPPRSAVSYRKSCLPQHAAARRRAISIREVVSAARRSDTYPDANNRLPTFSFATLHKSGEAHRRAANRAFTAVRANVICTEQISQSYERITRALDVTSARQPTHTKRHLVEFPDRTCLDRDARDQNGSERRPANRPSHPSRGVDQGNRGPRFLHDPAVLPAALRHLGMGDEVAGVHQRFSVPGLSTRGPSRNHAPAAKTSIVAKAPGKQEAGVTTGARAKALATYDCDAVDDHSAGRHSEHRSVPRTRCLTAKYSRHR